LHSSLKSTGTECDLSHAEYNTCVTYVGSILESSGGREQFFVGRREIFLEVLGQDILLSEWKLKEFICYSSITSLIELWQN